MSNRRRRGDTTVTNHPPLPLNQVFVQDDIRTLTDAVATIASLDLDAIRETAVQIGGVAGVRLNRLVTLAEQMCDAAYSTAEQAVMQTRLDVIYGGGDEVEVRALYGLPDNVRVLCPRRD